MAYSISVGSSAVLVRITNTYKARYFRIYIRYADDETGTVHDKFYRATANPLSVIVSELAPGEYKINVGYNNTGSESVTWIGAKDFTIVDDTPDPP